MAYLTSENYFLKRFDEQGRKEGLAAELNLTQLKEWQTRLREKLAVKLGLDTFQGTDFQPSYGPVDAFEGYSRQHVEINTEPGVRMPFYVLRPDDLKEGERRPLILALHGHGGGGKESIAGRRDIPAIAEKVDFFNNAYGLQLVKAGYVVLCPDARGFGERREKLAQGDDPEQVLGNSCRILNNMAYSLGQTLAGMMTWDLMRLLDYAANRSDCDMARVGCIGLSGGGMQTLWLSALDERVKVAVTSGYFYGYKDALLRLNGNCSCNYVPGLWQLVDMGDIGALICPRPLLIESGLRDHLNGERGIVNVTEQVAITGRAYAVAGAEEKLYHSIFDGPHRYDGRDVIPWFNRWLGYERGKSNE